MARWPRGEADVERLVRLGHLPCDGGDDRAQRSGQRLCARLRRRSLRSHRATRPPRAASHNGGGHVAVESVIRAQFGDGFRSFGFLRRRRNELEYPSAGLAASDAQEAVDALAQALSIIEAADRLLPNPSFFG